jgi:hypothetical protein
VPELGAEDSGHQGKGHHGHRIGPLIFHGDVGAAEAAVHDKRGGHSGQPHHQSEGVNGKEPEVNIRHHIAQV